jgi:excisionase family DNA binding protein
MLGGTLTVPKSIADDGLLSTSEVAKKLGVHRSTVWLWIRRGALPSEKRGAFHGVSKKALKTFLSVYKVQPSKPKKKAAKKAKGRRKK